MNELINELRNDDKFEFQFLFTLQSYGRKAKKPRVFDQKQFEFPLDRSYPKTAFSARMCRKQRMANEPPHLTTVNIAAMVD